MKKHLFVLLLTISLSCFAQPTIIRVTVPNATDDVFIVGNQQSLGNWNPEKVKLDRKSDFIREISLSLTFPAEFKFTRGTWETEGIIGNFIDNPNLKVTTNTTVLSYTIKGWSDNITSDNYNFPFEILKSYSEVFKQYRTISIALPEKYNKEKKYPVVYILDGSSLFESAFLTSRLLSNEKFEDDGSSYENNTIPEVIIVGIYHNNRGFETQPDLKNSAKASQFLLEGSVQLKDYLFDELVPFINKKYNTSGYNSIIGHSNTGHFVLNLPFQEKNPFRGIVALSVNSESADFNQRITKYLRNTDCNIYIGFGHQDNGFKALAEEIQSKIESKEILNPKIKVGEFPATHTQVPTLAMSSGLKFIFNDFNNLSGFKDALDQPNFSLEDYISDYTAINKSYGIESAMSIGKIITMVEIAIEVKNKEIFRALLTYAENHIDTPLYKNLIVYYAKEIGDYETADLFIAKILASNETFDNDMAFYNWENPFEDYFINKKSNPQEALNFLKVIIHKSAKHRLPLSFYYCKIAIEHNLEKSNTKRYLKYCEQNFVKNKYFDLNDLKLLKRKI